MHFAKAHFQNLVGLHPHIHVIREGRTRLPKLKFLAKLTIGLNMILELQIKKNQILLESDAQNYFNLKSAGVQPCTPL